MSATARSALCSRSEEHTSELQSRQYLVCRLLLEKKKKIKQSQKQCTHIEHTCTTPQADQHQCHSAVSRPRIHLHLLLHPALRGSFFFFFNDPATTEIYPLPLHDALPICIAFGQRKKPPRLPAPALVLFPPICFT